MWPLSIIVGGFAAGGQHIFARKAGIPDPAAWGATALFELLMIGFMVRGWLRARRNLSPALFWVVACGIGFASVVTQLLHSKNIYQQMIFAPASAGVLLLWLAKMYDSYRDYLRAQRKVVVPIGKYGRVWLLNPRRAWRAMLIGTEVQTDDVPETLRLAWTWRATYRSARMRTAGDGPDAKNPARLSSELAKITAWNAVNAMAGRPLIELPAAVVARVDLVENARPLQVSAIVGPERPDPPVDRWEHEQRIIEAVPVSPAVTGGPTEEQIAKWRDLYFSQIRAVKTRWRDPLDRNWTDATDPPSWTAIRDIVFAVDGDNARTGKGTMLNIRNVIIADRAAAAGVDRRG